MLQFTKAELAELVLKSKTEAPWIFDILEESIAPVRENYQIPTTGIATWRPFFACPNDSVPLVFDVTSPDSHRCPLCGEYFSGEPYHGAWWARFNSMLTEACRSAALMYLLKGERQYLDFAKQILLDYSKYYPDYEIHGNIPYNNPGRANAQTLTDAVWIKGLCHGYDYIRDFMTADEREYVESRLLVPAAEFFCEYRVNQLHNHEVIVSSSIGIIGLILGREDFIDFALDSKYGFVYQLENGLLEDGFWFEGTTSYHFFTIEQLVSYEYFARNTDRSLLKSENLLRAFKFPVNMLQPNGTLPPLNDIGANYQGFSGHENIFEFMYAFNPCDEGAYYLQRCYEGRPRENYYAFCYGREMPKSCIEPVDYHNDTGSGISTLHGSEGRFLLFKHTPYGGEHDHYDRLGIHFMAFDKLVIPDIGTCFYGAPMHYTYYKNTAAHNTVCLNGKNQPPAGCRVLAYEKTADYTLIDCEARWGGAYQIPDSFVIEQWDGEAYKNAVYRRAIAWFDDFFIDIFNVTAPNAETIDWNIHLRAVPLNAQKISSEAYATVGPYTYFNEYTDFDSTAPMRFDAGDGIEVAVFAATKAKLLCAPDNPSSNKLAVITERAEKSATFVNVICAQRKDAPVLKTVSFSGENGTDIKLAKADGTELEFSYKQK